MTAPTMRAVKNPATARPVLDEAIALAVRRALADLGPSDGELTPVEFEVLAPKHFVVRARAVIDGHLRSVVVKRLDPDVARRSQLAVDRWLPRLGLAALAPRLLRAVAAPDLEVVWHVYEDLRGVALARRHADAGRVTAAVDAIAALHTKAVGHPLLYEARRTGDDFGMHFFETNVGDALRVLESLRPPAIRPSPTEAALRDRLCRRLDGLLNDTNRRARAMSDAGGPETLLHGDLWTTNVLLVGQNDHERARLIDWDHVGVGPISYDLSTFLYRFERSARPRILDDYRTAVAPARWHLPAAPVLNLLSDTAECARIANRVIWPTIALLQESATWAIAELEEIERWFEALEPLLDV